jgi:hypothetical protein
MRGRGEWIYQLPDILEASGCRVLDGQTVSPCRELQRAWNDDWLAMWMSLIPLLPETVPTEMSPQSERSGVMARAEFAKLFREAVEECKEGVWLHMQQVVYVARKN